MKRLLLIAALLFICVYGCAAYVLVSPEFAGLPGFNIWADGPPLEKGEVR